MKPPRAESATWLRPAALVLFAITLPFSWREIAPRGCDAHALGASATESGIELFSRAPEASAVMLFLALAVTALGWAAVRARPLARLAAHLVSAVGSTMLTLLALFAATFSVFAPVRLRLAAYVGIGALALTALEALTRAGLAFARWFPPASGEPNAPPPAAGHAPTRGGSEPGDDHDAPS